MGKTRFHCGLRAWVIKMIIEAEQRGRNDFLSGVRYDNNHYDKRKQFPEYVAWKVGYKKEELAYMKKMENKKC